MSFSFIPCTSFFESIQFFLILQIYASQILQNWLNFTIYFKILKKEYKQLVNNECWTQYETIILNDFDVQNFETVFSTIFLHKNVSFLRYQLYLHLVY